MSVRLILNSNFRDLINQGSMLCGMYNSLPLSPNSCQDFPDSITDNEIKSRVSKDLTEVICDLTVSWTGYVQDRSDQLLPLLDKYAEPLVLQFCKAILVYVPSVTRARSTIFRLVSITKSQMFLMSLRYQRSTSLFEKVLATFTEPSSPKCTFRVISLQLRSQE